MEPAREGLCSHQARAGLWRGLGSTSLQQPGPIQLDPMAEGSLAVSADDAMYYETSYQTTFPMGRLTTLMSAA
eukprot:1195116-Prorocentrum_minimum.AAC.9